MMQKGRHDPAFIAEKRRELHARNAPNWAWHAWRASTVGALEGRAMNSGDHMMAFWQHTKAAHHYREVDPKHPEIVKHEASAAEHLKQARA